MDGDADGKSLPDIGCYEVANPDGDSDEDGMCDGDEDVADTDPFDPHSIFHVSKTVTTGNVVTISFDSSPTRLYTMMQTTNLVKGAWTNVPGSGPRLGSGGPDVMIHTNSVTPIFYKLKVTR
jgi:hypothetical protein